MMTGILILYAGSPVAFNDKFYFSVFSILLVLFMGVIPSGAAVGGRLN